MNTKRYVNVRNHGSSEKTLLDSRSTIPEAKYWAEHLSRFSEMCKKQLSDEELEEAIRRGCYKVLPPVVSAP